MDDQHAVELSTRETIQQQIDSIYARQTEARLRVAAAPIKDRIDKIRRLENAMLARRQEIRDAMYADFRKPVYETDVSETYIVVSEARHARRNLRRWTRPHRTGNPLLLLGTRSEIRYEPKGLVLIMSPWNFPFNLTLGPVVSAIAAGNCVVLKPSEISSNAAACMRRIIESLYDPAEVAVIEGDATVAQALLEKRWDHIFFTGNSRVGRIVMKAAAEHLTPVTLELGGKSPAIVDATANVEDAARKIIWGKFYNAGQMCIAPDYALVHRSVADQFARSAVNALDELYGSGESTRKASTDFGRVINDNHFTRLKELIDDALRRGASVVAGGESDPVERYVAPTVLNGVRPEAEIMQQEIFGPVLPILVFDEIEDALALIRAGEKPLALYLFAKGNERIERFLGSTSAGGTTVNDTLVHFFHPELPFGGIGQSGFGRAHGFHGFRELSNARGVTHEPFGIALTRLIQPPLGGLARKAIDLMMKYF